MSSHADDLVSSGSSAGGATGLFDALSRRDVMGIAAGALAAAAMSSRARGAPVPAQPEAGPRASLREGSEAVDRIGREIVALSRDVWAKAAVGLREHEAMESHIRVLERAGFAIVSRTSGGHPTAFVAEWSRGRGGPVLGFLPEYDALPELGNVAEAEQKSTPDGNTDGHGCGHNCLGAACTGAAIAVKDVMERANLSGTLRVYGCGAEENLGAKIFMAHAGLFKDLDAAIAWHPASIAGTGTFSTAANRKIYASWKGRTAHAGMSPWDGRSALDAAELFTHGVNLMREHVRPTSRLHYIYDIAGVAPNVVPEDARVWLVARDATSELVDATTRWLEQLARGAGLGTQTQPAFRVAIGSKELISNEALNRRVHEHLRHVPLDWTAEEQAFAKRCQKALGVPEAGLATQVLPFLNGLSTGGSTDVADVSWNCPVALFSWPTHPLGVSAHTWVVTACGGMSIGDKGTLAAARIMAALALDLLREPDLRAAAKEEHARNLKGRTYAATLDPEPEDLERAAKRFMKGMGDEGAIPQP